MDSNGNEADASLVYSAWRMLLVLGLGQGIALLTMVWSGVQMQHSYTGTPLNSTAVPQQPFT